jgi:hypothetical protein
MFIEHIDIRIVGDHIRGMRVFVHDVLRDATMKRRGRVGGRDDRDECVGDGIIEMIRFHGVSFHVCVALCHARIMRHARDVFIVSRVQQGFDTFACRGVVGEHMARIVVEQGLPLFDIATNARTQRFGIDVVFACEVNGRERFRGAFRCGFRDAFRVRRTFRFRGAFRFRVGRGHDVVRRGHDVVRCDVVCHVVFSFYHESHA